MAMHQVFKFGPYGGPTKEPLIALGEKFVPGSDDLHYCKPTSVAVMSDARTFFVSDGYCNQRVIKMKISLLIEPCVGTVEVLVLSNHRIYRRTLQKQK